MTVTYPGGDDDALFAGPADWVSPRTYAEPPPADGRKVVIADTDHIFGIGGNRRWVWKSFTRGLNVAFMDGYDGAGYGVGGQGFELDDPRWVSLRRNLGYTRAYAERMHLAAMAPHPDLCSTRWCLANPAAEGGAYLTYAPDGGTLEVDLSDTPGTLSVEWFAPGTARVVDGGTTSGGAPRTFTPPFAGDAVLFLRSVPPGPG
jgi:hypothetical protein